MHKRHGAIILTLLLAAVSLRAAVQVAAQTTAQVIYMGDRMAVWLRNNETVTTTVGISVYEVPRGGAMAELPCLQREAYEPVVFTLAPGEVLEALMVAPDCATHVVIYSGEHVPAGDLTPRSYDGRLLLSQEFALDRRCPGNDVFLPAVVGRDAAASRPAYP